MISGLITHALRHCINLLCLAVPLVCLSHHSLAADRWKSLAQPVFQTIEHSARPLVGPIRATAQDSDGYIWLVSDTTLWRWDAYQLIQVRFDLPTTKSGIIPDVNTIKLDPNGVLWVGTTNGLYRINKNPLQLESVAVNALNKQSIELLEFDFRSGKKRIFMGNEYHVLEWQVGKQTIERLSLSKSGENRVHAMVIDAKHQLWVGTNDGLLIKSLDAPSKSPLLLSSTLLNASRISALFTDSTQQLWIGTAKDGVFLIDQDQILHSISIPSQSDSYPWIYDITEPRPGIIWFGTYGKGILEYAIESQTVTAIRQQKGLTRNLLDNDIWSFFKDKRGIIWVGTRLGVNIYNPSQSAFLYLPGGMNASNAIHDSQFFSVIATKDDQLWLGTGSNGIEIIDPELGLIQNMSTGQSYGKVHIPDDAIETMFSADDNTVLTSSNWNTLQITRKPLTVQPMAIAGRDKDAFSGAFAIHHGNLWVGGTDGLWRLQGFDQSKAINVTKKIPVDYRISKILSIHDALWVGTWKGLFTVTEKENETDLPTIQIKPVKDNFLNQQYITDIAHDAEKRIWIGTYSAGLLHNTATGIARNKPWQILNENNGLPGNTITSIEADLLGNLWVATAQGIAVINIKTLEINTMTADQGSAAAPYEDGALTTKGEIVFVGNNGLTIIQPNLWRNIQYKAPMTISRIESNSVKPLVAQTLIDKDGVSRNMLVLSPEINRLSIEFSALDYIAASHLRYRYRLLGFDSHWIETDSKHRTATFTTLAPKVYEMQVQYSSDGKNWQNGTLSLFIDMQPAWYQKLWLHLALIGLALFLILFFIQWRTRRTLAYQNLLEQRISERTAELEQVNSLLQLQSQAIEEASLTDPLTGLKNRRFFTQHIDADTALAQRHYLNNFAAPNELKNADLIFFLIDIDHFKLINDKWGHASGDTVLIEMHHRLQRVFRESDYIVRWGGEEFLAVARGTSRYKAMELAERICQSVSQEPMPITTDQIHTVTCSIGYAAYPFFTDQPSSLNWTETLALADAALFSAKQSGRNTWVGLDSTGMHSTNAQISSLKISPKAAFQMTSINVQKGKTSSMQ